MSVMIRDFSKRVCVNYCPWNLGIGRQVATGRTNKKCRMFIGTFPASKITYVLIPT